MTADTGDPAAGTGARVAWQIVALLVPGAYALLLPAYLFRALGPEGYAPWVVATGVLTLLTVLDAGLSTTTTRFSARLFAGDDEAVATVRSAQTAYAALAGVGFVVGAVACTVVPLALDVGPASALDVAVVGVALSLDLAVVLFTSSWTGILRGWGRYDLLLVVTGVQVAVALPAAFLLVPELGLPGAALAQLAGRVVSRAIAAAILARRLPWFSAVPLRGARSAIRHTAGFAGPILLLQLATQLGTGTDPIIVGAVAGPTEVGLFGAGSQAARLAAWLLFPVISVAMPVFAAATYRADVMTEPLLRRAVMLGSLGLATAFGGLATNAGPVLELWVGRAEPLSVQVLVLYAVAYALMAPGHLVLLMLIARGTHARAAMTLVALSIGNVVLSLVLAQGLGSIGPAVASLADAGLRLPRPRAGHRIPIRRHPAGRVPPSGRDRLGDRVPDPGRRPAGHDPGFRGPPRPRCACIGCASRDGLGAGTLSWSLDGMRPGKSSLHRATRRAASAGRVWSDAKAKPARRRSSQSSGSAETVAAIEPVASR